MFYTVVMRAGKFILVRGYLNGKRFSEKIPYKPYVFIPTKSDSQYKTLENLPVKKESFADIWEVKDFLKKYDNVAGFKFYGITRWEYQYIHDEYPGKIDFDSSIIKVGGIDIEVSSEGGYPNVETADKQITAITYALNDKYVVFAYGDYIPHKSNITYIKCKDEADLLQKFLIMWNTEDWTPDVISGWNIDGFDIPYLVRRIALILGENESKRLSPWKILKEKTIIRRARQTVTYVLFGIATLDYMDLYKKYTPNQQSSYSLNNICHIELNEKKIDYSEYLNLDDLCEKNHQLFIEYNIRDVELIFKLDAKLKFIELVYAVAYDAKINLVDAFTSVLLWDIIIYNYLMDRNIVIPQAAHKHERPYEGGYVKEPIIGLNEWVVSVDVTSEYPKTIIQYNLSPETFVKKIPGITVESCLKRFPDPEIYAITANGCMF